LEKQHFLSEFLVRNLVGSVTGDDGFFPYKKGVELVLLFNKFGFKDTYPESMNEEGSRKIYTERRIRQLRKSEDLKKLIEMLVDPREFYNNTVTIDDAVTHINEYLKFDEYEVRHDGVSYRFFSSTASVVEPKTTSTLSHDFIREQIEKCEEKLASRDYDGAITNARSLIEAVSIKLIETKEQQNYKSNGNLVTIFKDLRKTLNMAIDKEHYPSYLIEIISGLTTVIQGIAELTNKAGDRHSRTYKPQKHHAKLAVNCAFSFCDFILESFYYRQEAIGDKKNG
jgi:hypothetical protein